MVKLVFKDGTEMIGTIIAEALVVYFFKSANYYYLINKLALLEDGVIKL